MSIYSRSARNATGPYRISGSFRGIMPVYPHIPLHYITTSTAVRGSFVVTVCKNRHTFSYVFVSFFNIGRNVFLWIFCRFSKIPSKTNAWIAYTLFTSFRSTMFLLGVHYILTVRRFHSSILQKALCHYTFPTSYLLWKKILVSVGSNTRSLSIA